MKPSRNFLAPFKSDLARRWIGFADAVVHSSQLLPFRIGAELAKNPRVSAKLLPSGLGQRMYVQRASGELVSRDPQGLAIPPSHLWVGYGGNAKQYLRSGEVDVTNMLRLLEAANWSWSAGMRVLEFGSAAGRMLRWLAPFATTGEVWGVDMSAEHIEWCQEYLAPPFSFATTTTFPYLPFEERYFDLVFAGSVFTHISDLTDAWLLELRRILKPGGWLYLTLHDTQTLEYLLGGGNDYGSGLKEAAASLEAQEHLLRDGFQWAVLRHANGDEQVFYDTEYVRRRWGRLFRVQTLAPRVYGYQSAALLNKA